MITQRTLSYWALHQNRLQQLFLLLLILVSILLRIVPLEMQKRIVNTAIKMSRTDLLYQYCALYMAAVLLSGLLKYAANVYQKRLGQRVLVQIRRQLYIHILQMPLQFFRKTPPGTVITAMIAELNSVGHFIGGAVAVPITSAATLLLFAGYMIWLNPFLGVISMAIYPFELLVVPALQRKFNRINVSRIDTVREMSNTISEAISGIHEVQGNAGFYLEAEKIAPHIEDLATHYNRMAAYKFGIKFVNNLFQSFGPFLLFLVGGYLAIHGQFTLGALVAFLTAYEKLYDPWKEIIEYYQDFQDAQVRYQRVMEQFDIAPDFRIAPEHRLPLKLSGRIEVAGLSYTVDKSVRLLSDVSMMADAGEHVALVGFSGSGKSTLAMVLAQLYGYSEGAVQLDGRPLAHLTKADTCRNIAFVAQHPFIFNGSIRENLLYGCTALSRQMKAAPFAMCPDRTALLEMVRDVGLADDVVRFGLNAVISPERHPSLAAHLFRMRRMVGRKLMAEHADKVEFYHVNRFMHYLPLHKNIIFGDARDRSYTPEHLPKNERFIAFLRNTGLFDPLMHLGQNLLRESIFLLKDLHDDEFFYKGMPIEPDEYALYKKIDDRVDAAGITGLGRAEANRVLTLALRYIPGRHKMGAITESLQNRIVAARQSFLKEVVGVDIERCMMLTDRFMHGDDAGWEAHSHEKEFFLYCPAEFLLSRSLMENIVFGTLKSDDAGESDALRRTVAEQLNAEGLMDEVMDVGLEFNVGSKGDRLSGGQKQKVAIARALLKDCPILIMDEATASLDNASQAGIQRYVERKLRGRTTVVAVIHRLDLAPAFDQILLLKAGRVAESGTYEALMNRKGVFYELVRGNRD